MCVCQDHPTDLTSVEADLICVGRENIAYLLTKSFCPHECCRGQLYIQHDWRKGAEVHAELACLKCNRMYAWDAVPADGVGDGRRRGSLNRKNVLMPMLVGTTHRKVMRSEVVMGLQGPGKTSRRNCERGCLKRDHARLLYKLANHDAERGKRGHRRTIHTVPRNVGQRLGTDRFDE